MRLVYESTCEFSRLVCLPVAISVAPPTDLLLPRHRLDVSQMRAGDPAHSDEAQLYHDCSPLPISQSSVLLPVLRCVFPPVQPSPLTVRGPGSLDLREGSAPSAA